MNTRTNTVNELMAKLDSKPVASIAQVMAAIMVFDELRKVLPNVATPLLAAAVTYVVVREDPGVWSLAEPTLELLVARRHITPTELEEAVKAIRRSADLH